MTRVPFGDGAAWLPCCALATFDTAGRAAAHTPRRRKKRGGILILPPQCVFRWVKPIGAPPAEGATIPFEVYKSSFERVVTVSARDYGQLYGLVTAMMALATGWFASVVFRRD